MKTFTTTLAMATALGAQAGTLHTFTSDASGFDTHSYFYDDGREVTVFDTQFLPALTEAIVARIKETTDSPITRVVVTHPNPDKFNGLPVLHALGANSVASAATQAAMPGVHAYKRHFWVNVAGAFTEETYPKLEPVRTTFTDRTVLQLASGETITLFELKHAGVASTQTVARIDRTGDLIVGDLVHYRAHAWLEGGIVDGRPRPDLAAWRAAVAELPALGTGRVYGGRGEVGGVAEVVAFQTDYLGWAESQVDAYVAEVPAEELADPAQAAAHHAKLQARFAAARPDLGLAYLVGYGIYGLLNSKLE
jgi:glyoxylase-like metal-dependent hydrolase (beta-lactamase superfamily II)